MRRQIKIVEYVYGGFTIIDVIIRGMANHFHVDMSPSTSTSSKLVLLVEGVVHVSDELMMVQEMMMVRVLMRVMEFLS